MPNDTLGKFSAAFGLSLIVTSVLSALLVVAKEISEPLKAWMKAFTGHHWTTHGLLTLALFLVLGLILAGAKPGQWKWLGATRLAALIAAATVVSGLIIAGFFLAEG